MPNRVEDEKGWIDARREPFWHGVRRRFVVQYKRDKEHDCFVDAIIKLGGRILDYPRIEIK